MTWITDVLVGAVVVVAVVGSLIFMAKRGWFEPETTEEATDDREELSRARTEDFSIPFRSRVGAWSFPFKLVVFGGLGGVAVMAIAMYSLLKSGAPVSRYFSSEVRYGLVAIIGVGGGVRLARWFDSQIGTLYVEYEREGSDNEVEAVHYAKGRERRREGYVALQEVAKNRLLGLFWRFRQVGEDRRLRTAGKPVSDVVTHQLPDHGQELPDGDGYHVRTRSEGDKVLEGPTSVADVTYRSPNSLSDEEAVRIREQKKRKDAELRGTKATNAELNARIRELEKKIQNAEYQDRQELLDDFKKFADMMKTEIEIDDKRDSVIETNGDEEAANA